MNDTSLQEMDQGKAYETFLTHGDFKNLQKMLPNGYSLTVSNKNTRNSRNLNSKKNIYQNNYSSRKNKRRSFNVNDYVTEDFNFKKAMKIVSILKKHESADPFLYRVDPVKLGIPNYFDIIKYPMDLSTVEKKLRNRIYETESEFESDIYQIWENAMTFNPDGSMVYKMAQNMKKEFISLKSMDMKALIQKKFKPIKNQLINVNKYDIPLSYEEQVILKEKIERMQIEAPEHLYGVYTLISSEQSGKGDKIDFNIAQLPPKKARELERYVNNNLSSLSGAIKKKKIIKTKITEKTADNSNEERKEKKMMEKPQNYNMPIIQQPEEVREPPKLVNPESSISSFISDLESDN